ncbi:hypothetical protein [Sulfurimonas aquatica]|uniref:hypothetical protein n=1 Tax=Sulfurimonas aquatica TaxID=2672570 RepID=UPI001F624424|nr:hypothetical protein [Sulfurimonas aquatica]
MQEQIYKITPEVIDDDISFIHLIASLPDHSYYWSDEWSADFYISLAKRGFICVSHDYEGSLVLLP